MPREKPRTTVLVVDDEEPIRRLERRVLEEQNYEVSEAADGLAAD
jgi:CheY-like chemotaxis protein